MEEIRKIIRIIRLVFKINWVKTLYVNFKTQRLSEAIKLPIIVFGKLKLKSLKGKIIFECPVKFGIIQIGKDIDYLSSSYLPTIISISSGNVIFKGKLILSGGNTIICNGGNIILGKYVILATGVNIRSYKKIEIGEYTRLASNCFIMDTNVHYLLNNENKKVSNIQEDIFIGKYCWLNSGTTIAKGAIIPDYSISTRNSYLNKDYSLENRTGLLLVGSPARIKGENYQRIFSYATETRIKKIFRGNEALKEIDLSLVVENDRYVEGDKDFEAFFKIL